MSSCLLNKTSRALGAHQWLLSVSGIIPHDNSNTKPCLYSKFIDEKMIIYSNLSKCLLNFEMTSKSRYHRPSKILCTCAVAAKPSTVFSVIYDLRLRHITYCYSPFLFISSQYLHQCQSFRLR